MDLTHGTLEEKNARAKKMMLWFLFVSIGMSFAGLTSAYIVSKSRPDWLNDFEIPQAFYYSTIVILLSSFTIHLAKKAIQDEKMTIGSLLLGATLALGITFTVLQIMAYSQIIDMGYHFTGATSNPTMSFVYIVSVVHLLHIVSGLIVLLVISMNQIIGKYKGGQTLGLELGVMFWHFLDFLWIYLILFLYFVR